MNMAEARASSSLGGYDDEFVKEIDEDWQCGICQLPMKEPVLTKCGHKFCIQCLNAYFSRLERDGQPLICPVDRNNLLRDKDIFPDKAAERKILSFVIKCPSEGCQWTGELRSKDNHLASCPFKVVQCTNVNCHVRLLRKTLQKHVTKTCEWRILHCDHCNVSHPACKKEVHQRECTRFPLNCPQNCEARDIAREEIPSHVEKDCPLTIVACPHAQIGCTAKVQRRMVEFHLQSAIEGHLDLACKKLNNTEIQLSSTQTQLKNTQEELKETKRNLEDKVNTLENRLVQFPGVHTWKIIGFSEIMKKAKSGEETEIKSAPFYDHGYKFRLSLNPNGSAGAKDTHLAIYFCIMKGEFDALLSWPFQKKVTFTLVDQQEDLNDRKNVTKTFTADDDEDFKECFMRPWKDELVGCGTATFVHHDKLKERPYIVDDTIFVQVKIAAI